MNAMNKLRRISLYNLFNKYYYTNIKSHLQCNKMMGNNESSAYKEPNQIKTLLKFWEKSFTKHNIPEPKNSIEHILAFSLGSTRISDVYNNLETVLTLEEAQEINNMCIKRLKRMPVQYIIEEWDFRDLTLKMKPPVFIPRPETEMLIDIIINDIENKKYLNILDICCGSGAISLALLKSLPEVKITAIDSSQKACDLTLENAKLHNLENRITILQRTVEENNLLNDISENFDIIVSNPPYVPEKIREILEPEIANYEDLNAIFGGEDGLKVIKPILKIASKKLKKDGPIYFEIYPTQSKIIEDYVQNNFNGQIKFIKTYKDFAKKNRFIKLCKIN